MTNFIPSGKPKYRRPFYVIVIIAYIALCISAVGVMLMFI